jgi:hypothetical protein
MNLTDGLRAAEAALEPLWDDVTPGSEMDEILEGLLVLIDVAKNNATT